MSWNNLIPWEVLECDRLCFKLNERVPIATKGWKHHEECLIGKRLMCKHICAGRDQANDGGPIVHAYGCPIGKKLEQQNGSKKNSSSDPEGSKELGGSVQVGYAGVKPGSPDSDPNW